MTFYPSEVARLVLGYLHENNCLVSAEIFLRESPHLEEHRNLVKNGKFHSLTVNDKTLGDYLNELYCQEDLKGSKEKFCVSGSSKKIVHVGVQTNSLSLTQDGEGVQIAADESDVQESVHEVLLSPNEEYIIHPFETTSLESLIEQPFVLALKITDSFIVSDELFDSQNFANIHSQNNVAIQRRKGFPPRKLLTDSLVCKKLDNNERYCTPDLLQKDMVFLDQLLCHHPVVQKIAYTINRVKENELREDKNFLPSNKDSMHIEEIVRETVAEVESNIFVHSYFDFLCYQRDSCMSFRKSRYLNFDKHQEKLSTVSSKAHEASDLNLEEYFAEDSTVVPLEIIPDTISATDDIADPHLKNLHSNKAKADSNLTATKNIILGALNDANTDESTFADDGSCDIQNSAYETSGMPSDVNEKNTSNNMNEILSYDQSDGHSLSVHSQQKISNIIVEENKTSKSEVMMPAELLEKQNSGWKQSQLIPEKTDNIQPANIQNSTLMDLSLNVTNIDESISVAHDSSNIQNSAKETSGVPSELDSNKKNTSNSVIEIISDDQSDGHSSSIHYQQNIGDIIMEENTTSKSEVMIPAELLEKQNSGQLIPEKIDNIQPADIQSSTLMDLYLNVTNIVESISVAHDSSGIQNSANERTVFPSELGVNQTSIANSVNEILPDDQTGGIPLPIHFQQKVRDIIMKEIINTSSESEVLMPTELSNTQKSVLISKESGNVRSPNFSNNTSGYVPIMTMFQKPSQPSNPFISPQFPPAHLNSIFMPSTSNMYFIQDNFIYQVMGPNVNSASSLNSNLFEASSSMNNWSPIIINSPIPTSNINSLASSYDGILPVSSSCSVLPTSSVLSSSSNDSIIPTFSSNFSTGVLRNAQPASLSNTFYTVLNNVSPVPLSSINLPLLTNIANVPLCSTTQLNTNSLHIPALDNVNITQIPINSPHVTSIVGTLQDIELVVADGAENKEKESTRSLPDFEEPIVSEDKKKSKIAKKGKNEGKKGNNKRRPKNSEICLKKKQHCQRPTRKIVRCPLLPFNPNLENYANVGLVEPVLPSNVSNLSTSSNQEHPVVPNVTKNPSSKEENVNDRTQLVCSSKTYLGCRTSTSNFIVKNNCSENGPISIQFDSESNNSILKNKNPVCITSELNEKCIVVSDILNCTNSDVNAANDKMTMPLVYCVDSTTLNSTYSDVDSAHDEATIPSRCLTSSSAPISTNSYVVVANDEITNLECVTNSNILNGINSDVVITDDQTTNSIPSSMNSYINEAGDQTTVSLSSSKDCTRFSNTTFDYMINDEMDEEDIPLSELKNKKCLEQSSPLKVSSIRVCAGVSNAASDNAENEEDIPLSELKNKKCLEQSSPLKVSSIRVCAEVSNAASDNAENEEDILSEFQYRKAHERKSFKKLPESSGSKKAYGKFADTRSRESCFTSEEFSQSSNILENNCNSAKGANKSVDDPVCPSYSSILNVLFPPTKKCSNQEIPLQVKNVCAISSVPEHLSSSSHESRAETVNLSLCSSVISSLKDNGCFKKTNYNYPVSRKCENIGDLDQNIRSSKSKRKNSSSKGKLSKMSLKQEETSHSDLANLRSDDKFSREISSNFPVELEKLCTIPSPLPKHFSSSCGETLEAGDVSVSLLLKDPITVQNSLNPIATESLHDSSTETLNNIRGLLSQRDNVFSKQRNHNHSVSRKSENIGNLDKNIRSSKAKRRKSSSKKIPKRKLWKNFTKQKEETSHPDLINIKTDDKPSVEISFNFPVEVENLSKISSLPEHLSNSCDKTLGASDSSVSLLVVSSPKDTSKLQNNINPVSSDAFQNNGSSVETLDNKQALLSQTGNNCFKQANDNHAVSRKRETFNDSYQNIKSSETKQRKNSSNETLKRKLPKRFTKQTEKTSHSDFSNLKTNDKTNLEVSNFLAETENLHASPSLPEHLSFCVETKAVTNNSSPVPLLLKDGAQFQNTLHPVTAESFESDNSPPERLANTNAFLDPIDNSCLKQTNVAHTISKKSETISNLDQNIILSKRKRRKNSSKETLKGRSPNKFTTQKKKSSYSELANLKTNEKCRVKNPTDFSVEMESLHSIPSLHTHFSNSCSETQVEVKNSSTHLLPKASIELQNSLIPVTSDSFPSDNSSDETLDNIRAFLSCTDIKDNYGVSRKCKAISDKVGNQNIRSSEIKVLRRHSRKQSNPKKVTSMKQFKHKLKKHSKKETKRKCKLKETKNLAMQKTYQALSLKAFSSRSSTEKINGIKETLEEDLLKCIASKNENATGYVLDIKKSHKTYKAKKQNGCKLSSKKQNSVKAKLYQSSKKSLCSKQKINMKTFENINDLRNLNSISDQNNLDLDEKHEITTSLDKRVTLDTTHKEMVLIPMKKRMVFDYLKHEYLESFNNFFQRMLLLIRYAKEIDQFYFEIKKILLFKFISQKNINDLLAKYLDGKLHIKNLKTNSVLLKSALNSEDSDKSPSIDIFKQFCCKTSAIQQQFERRFKFGMKMYHEKMQIKKSDIIKNVDLHLLYLELHSIKESLIKKSSISKEKVYSFEDPAFSLDSELFSQQPIVLIERLNIPPVIRNIIDGTESQSCERNSKNFEQTVSIKNLVSSSRSESRKPFSATLLNVRGPALKKPSGLTIMSSLISFNGGNVWPDEFKNKIVTIFETTMDTALFVNNILFNICEYSCDISKLVLGNNISHQNRPHSLLVDSSEKKRNSVGEFPLLDETIVSPAEDLTNENDVVQRHSPPKRQRVSLKDLSFTEQISKALGDLKVSTVDNSQNSLKTHEISDLQTEISSFCIVKSEAKKKSCKSMEKSDFHPQQDSGNIRNKSVVHKNTSKKVKQNNKEIADLKISRKLIRSNKPNPSNLKKQQDSKVTKKENLNSFRKSCRKLLLNSLPDAHIFPESEKLKRYAPPINADKECCLTSREAADNDSFSTMSESFISDSLNDSSSNTLIYGLTSTNQEHLGFKIKESTNPKELHIESKGICAAVKESTEQTKILENSISEITHINLDERGCSFNDKIPVSLVNDKYKKQALNSFKENGNPCVTPKLAETDGGTNIDGLNGTEADHSQNISQKSCIQSSIKSKTKKEIVSLHKSSLRKKNPKSVLKSKIRGSPRESSSSLFPQLEEVDESSTSISASNLSLSILYNTDEFLAALGEKSVTEKKKKSAEIVMNCILEMGIEGFTKLLPSVT